MAVEVEAPRELGDLGATIDRAARRFTADGADYVAATDTLTARATTGRIELVPVDVGATAANDGTPLALETIAITAGTRTLDPAARSTTVDADGDLVVDRGEASEQIAMQPAALEQQWTFATSPGANGDLVVRVAVTGESFVAATDSGLHFAGADGLGVVYSDATWIDAGGDAEPIAATWDGAAIELRVPREVIARSAFPAVLDPQIAAEKGIDTAIVSSPTGETSKNAQAAFSGAQYLVVWEDNRAGNADIYATRMSTTGAITDTAGLPIAANAWAESAPTVAFVGTSYLVAWVSGNGLAGAKVSTTGVVTPLTITATGGRAIRPRLAAHGTQALLVYESSGNVYASRFSGTAFGASFAVASTGATEAKPTVDADPTGNYLVAWVEGTTNRDVRGRLVTAAGAVTGSAIDISCADAGQVEPTAAFVAGNHVVVWTNDSRRVYGARVSAVGAVLDTRVENSLTVGGFALAAGAGIQHAPSLACSAATCMLTWQNHSSATTGEDIYAMPLPAGLVATSAAQVVSAGTRQELRPSVIAAGTGFFATWDDGRTGANLTTFGSRLAATGTALDPAGILIARGYNEERTPAIARGSTDWLAVWGDSRVIGNNILGSRVNNGGNTVDDPALSVSNATAQQSVPAVAASGVNGAADWMAVWADRRGTSSDIYAARITAAGAISDLTAFAVSTAARDQVDPAIASDSAGKFLVVWSDQRPGSANWDVWGAVVSTAGAVVVPEFKISGAIGPQQRPVAAYDPVHAMFLVLWEDSRNGADQADVMGARVTAAGAVLDASGVVIAGAAKRQYMPALDFGTSRFLVVWRDQRNDIGDIYAARVRITGAGATGIAVDDPSGIAIAVATGKQYQPTVAFQQRGSATAFALAWSDERNLATKGSDIYGQLVTEATGALLGAQHTLSADPESELRPVLARGRVQGSAVRTILLYESYSTTQHAYRVMSRRITYNEL